MHILLKQIGNESFNYMLYKYNYHDRLINLITDLENL